MAGRRRALGHRTWSDVVILAILLIFAAIIILPFINAITISFISQQEYIQNRLTMIPKAPTLSAYKNILDQGWLGLGYQNSAVISGLGWIYLLTITVITAYAITRSFPGRRVFLVYLLIPMFFSGGLVPAYLQIRNLGLINSYGAVLLPTGVSAYYILIMSSFFRSIHVSLEESARLDGASEARILLSIILPLSKAILATISLFVIVGFWNEWFSPMLYLQRAKMMPLQVYLRNIVDTSKAKLDRSVVAQAEQIYPEAVRMAAVMVTMLPIMAVYPFLQKYFVKGVMIGAVKG
ncbi:MAG: carbohydrate ABC transporter permease [Clostridia bacterium]|nr:carbohydrate ABC transporter permease [Clostridia bacterium]